VGIGKYSMGASAISRQRSGESQECRFIVEAVGKQPASTGKSAKRRAAEG
jgi:hypothetical protein